MFRLLRRRAKFTTLEENCGYWQTPVANVDRNKAAFVTHSGFFEYLRMPFGLTNAPATFQRIVDIVLGQYKWQTCLVYIDDVIIFSKDVETHIEHVDEILTALGKAGISLKLKKCDFFGTCIKYLGQMVRPDRLEIMEARIKSLHGM